MQRATRGSKRTRTRIGGLGRLASLAIAVLLPAASATGADPAPPLFTAAPAADPFASGDPTVVRDRSVTFDPATLESAAADQRVLLNLFDDAAHVARFDQIDTADAMQVAIRGTVEGHPGSSVTLVLRGDVLAGIVRIPGVATYRMRTVEGGLTEISEVDESQFPACGPQALLPDGGPDGGPGGGPGAGGDPGPGPLGDPAGCDDGSLIDVLVLYTPLARVAAGGAAAIEAEAALAIVAANDAYLYSDIAPRLRLVHTAETSYSETGSYNDHLTWLTGTADGIMDEVHQLRDDYGADLVALLVDDRDYCGLAYLMTSPGPGFATFGFSVTTWICATGNLSFAHELGHNMGCCHDHLNCSGGAYTYSWGHRFIGNSSTQWRTVMSYSPGNRIQFFSNPDVDFDGQPTGLAEGDPNAADNARTIDETAAIVASFRCSINDGLFTGPSGGRWLDDANWGAGVVPGATTDVILPTLVVLDGPGAQAANVTIEANNGLLYIELSGALTAQDITVESASSLIMNDGSVTADDIDVHSGAFITTFHANGDLTATSIDILSGGVLSGIGAVTADVTNSGEVRPGLSIGTLDIDGDYTQSAGGLLSMEVESLSVPDLLDVTGTATLDGTLRVRVPSGPLPTPPECFTLVDAATLLGTFASTDLEFLTTDNEFEITYDGTSATACVVSLTYPLLVGGATGDQAGFAVANAGDVDKDGYDDAVVGVPFADAGGASAGQVLVFSGRTGAILYTRNGRTGSRLGWSVAGAGDVNKDGYDDFMGGAPYDRDQKGRVRVYSGKNGSVLHTKNGRKKGDRFGWSVAGGADVDDDGRDDFFVGAPHEGSNGKKAGAAYLYSGRHGDEIERFFGEVKGDRFGWSVAMLRKANGDKYADVAVGAPRNDDGGGNAGKVYVYSGKNGSGLYDLVGRRKGDKFGSAVAAAGRVDSDTRDDLVVGSPYAKAGGASSAGRIDVFSGRDGDLIWARSGSGAGDRMGWAVAGAGDVDGDGRDDVLVGIPRRDTGGSNAGRFDVRSGRTGSTILLAAGAAPGDELGAAVAGMGDLDDDGLAEVLVGAPKNDLSGANAGQMYLYFTDGPPSPDPGFDLAGDAPGGRVARAIDGAGRPPLDAALLLAVVDGWGACPGGACPGDVNGDGVVDATDLFAVLDGPADERVVAEAEDDAGTPGVVVAPAAHGGVLVVPGAFAPGADDALLVEIAGAISGDEHDLVVVDGEATLDGALVVALAHGFEPLEGEEFTVLVADGLGGVFAEIVTPTPAWDVRYGADAVTVRAEGGGDVEPIADRDLAFDLTDDGRVDVRDVLALLDAWGTAGAADFTGDEVVDALDLTLLLDELR